MVVHTPTKLEVLRQTAAERRAAADGDVPPSVAAAAAVSIEDTETVDAAVGAVDEEVGGVDRPADDPLAHEFAAWNGNVPPGIEVDAVVHAATGQEQHVNVTTRKKYTEAFTGGQGDAAKSAEEDKISVVSDVTPPPPPSGQAGNHPQINPFTQEWFANLIGAAASAAAHAAVAAPRPAAPAPPPPTTVPRRLNERKIPDFWEDKPDFWFRIFDAHLAHFSPSEIKCFDALLPLLTPSARTMVHSLIQTPGRTPYTKARQVLLRHFGRTPHQLAREFRDTRSLGDRLPSEHVEHLQSLLPDISALYEVMLLDSLPSNARDAALQHTGLAAMSAAADQVILGNRALAASDVAAVNAVAFDYEAMSLSDPMDRDRAAVAAVSRPQAPRANPGAGASAPRSSAPRRNGDLCPIHARWGKEAFKCLRPSYCRMRDVVRPKPPAPASGNGRAGSH